MNKTKKISKAKKISQGMNILGEITLISHKQSNFWLKKWNFLLRFIYKLGFIDRRALSRLYAKGTLISESMQTNIIATSGFSVLAQILAGEYADTGAINYMALGNGVGTPAVGDVSLFNEVYRNETASSTTSGAIAICTAFFTETEVDGTFTEFGNFIDGTGTVDTGELWSHINVSWEKSDEETWTVQCKYTFANKP